MKSAVLLLCVLSLFASFAFSTDKNSQPKPAILSGKTISFITFATGEEAGKLKREAAGFFDKWKRYQVVNDPTHADLIVLLGPMPNHVNSDAWDAVLSGKPSPVPVDTMAAQSQFAVFDASEVRGTEGNGPLRPVWSTEMNSIDVKTAARKYKQLVDNTQESYDHLGLTFEKCRMVGLRCSH
jgi:hypothetical protein